MKFIESLSFKFNQNSDYFFNNITLDLSKSGLTFVAGKNGVGKSTLFRILQGLINPQEKVTGKLHINDITYDVTKASDRTTLYNTSMILHQNVNSMLADQFTGLENLQFAKFDTYPPLSFTSSQIKISHLAQQFNVPLDKPVHQLSGGQKQILALLMATQKPIHILLLDEPTAALDYKNSHYVMQSIQQLAQEKNILILCISHDQNLIDTYAQNIITIKEENEIRTITVQN